MSISVVLFSFQLSGDFSTIVRPVSDVLASRPLTADLEARCSWQRAAAQILILILIVILQQNGGMQVIPRQNGGMQVIPRQNGGMPDSMVGTQI